MPDQVLAYVEYVDDHPFEVAFVHPDLRCLRGLWDVEWCKRDEALYAHQSGSGGQPGYHVTLEAGCGRRVWLRPGLPLLHWNPETKDNDLVTREAAEAVGYEFLADEPADPFEGAEMDVETVYCVDCDDYLPDYDAYQQPCEHLTFCEDVSAWVRTIGNEHEHDGERHAIDEQCGEVVDAR